MKNVPVTEVSECRSAGAYGRYFPLNNGKGVKALKGGQYGKNDLGKSIYVEGFDSPEAAIRSEYWKEAIKEATALRAAEFTGVTPKFYQLTVVKYERRFYPGIVMEHIEGTTLHQAPQYRDCEKANAISSALKSLMDALGFKMGDLHHSNIMVNKEGRPYVIDFTPVFAKSDRVSQVKLDIPGALRDDESTHCDFDMDLFRAAQFKMEMGEL